MLAELDEALQPRRLSDEVRIYVLSVGYQQFALHEEFDFNDDQNWQESSKRAAARAYDLGTVVAGEPQIIEELSQELFTAGNGYLIEFGRGMASTCRDLEAIWGQLVKGLELAGDQAWHCGVLVGALEVIQQGDEPLAQKVLDEAVQNPTLRKFIVNLQASVPWSHAGVERLHKSLDFDDTPSQQFINLARHCPVDASSETDLQDLMLRILNKPNGAEFVLEGLCMRPHVLKERKLALGPELKRVGLLASAALLRTTRRIRIRESTARYMSEVLASCLDETDFPEETNEVFDAYFARLRALHVGGGRHDLGSGSG